MKTSSTHPQRKHLVSEKKPYPKSKPKKDNDFASTSHLNKKVRDTERLLNREEINAEVRIAAERQLRALQIDLQEARFEAKEKKLSVRYHRIKFFERQKVTRKIKQTEKLLKEADSNSQSDIKRTLQELRLDLNYILHFPKSEKYVSLFPKENGDDPVSSEKRNKVREDIRALMHRGKLTDAQQIWRKDKQKVDKQKKSKTKSVTDNQQHLDLAEDDDFFAAPEKATKPNKVAKHVPSRDSEEDQVVNDEIDKENSDDSEDGKSSAANETG